MTDPLAPPPAPPVAAPVEAATTAATSPSTPAPSVSLEPAIGGPVPPAASPPAALGSQPRPPTFVFFGIVAAISLVTDVATKAWAEITLSNRNPLTPSLELIKDHLAFTLAYNKGGAWGIFQNHPESIRRPFFLLVSLLAVAFIINLYGRLLPGQRALKWGLPLVLGGALGNLSDRIVRSNVIDFIDYQAAWIESMNRLVAKVVSGWAITDHWPTFNVADIAICVGVGLMAVDMFTSRRSASVSVPPRPPEDGRSPPADDGAAPLAVAPLSATPGQSTPPLKPEA